MKKKPIDYLTYTFMVIISITFIFPIFYILTHSFKNQTIIFRLYQGQITQPFEKLFIEPFVINLGQYGEILLRTPEFLSFFWNSIYIVLPIIILQLIISVFAAYGFAKLKFIGSEILFYIYIIVMLMPFQVTAVPNYIILSKLNLLDNYLSLILPGVFSTFGIFFLKQYIESLREVYLEEARLQGASEVIILFSIVIPISKPILSSIFILLFAEYWNMVEQPVLFLYNQSKYPLSVYLAEIIHKNIGIAFACSVIYMVPAILLAFYVQADLIDSLGGVRLK